MIGWLRRLTTRIAKRRLADKCVLRRGRQHRPKRRRQAATDAALSRPTEPNALWCAGDKGEFMLGDRRYCYPLTITDFASRYLLTCEALRGPDLPVSPGMISLTSSLPVWQAGVAVHIKVKPLSVLGSQSTMHPHLEVKKPSRQAARRAESLKEKELAELLGLHARLATSMAGTTSP